MRPAVPAIMGLLLVPLLIQGCELPNLPPPVQPPQQPPPQPPQQQQPVQPPLQQQPLPQQPPQLPPLQPQPQQPLPQQPPQPQPIEAPPSTKVSVFDKANYTDLGVGPDGTRHALYQETDEALGREQVYYRASTDGGQTWTAAVNLSAFDPAHRVGFIRLAIDGEGRVYAFWKATSEYYDNPAGDGFSGTLVYRVLAGGGWSEAVEVSALNGTYSWFPSVAPNGQLHVVWNEIIPYGQIFQLPQDAGLVLHATVTGTALGPKREVYRAPLIPLPGPDGQGAGQAVEGLTGLKGYVDAMGKAHWVAEKRDIARDTTVVVHWDGARESVLFDQDQFTLESGFTQDPPQLLVDDQGFEHVIIRNSVQETQTLIDYPLQNRVPVAIREAIDFKGFNVVQGAGGRMAVTFSVKDTYGPDSRYDLFASVYRNGTWSPSANLTGNLAQDVIDGGQTQAGTYLRHEFHDTGFTAGAFDAAGKLNLLYIDTAATQVDLFGNLNTDLSPAGGLAKPAAYFKVM